MGSKINSYCSSASQHYHREDDDHIENKRLHVQIGRVDTSRLPWTFNAKTEDARDSPITCHLAKAADLPVAAHFEQEAEHQNGEFEMIILATLKNHIKSVKLFYKDSKCNVATFLVDAHKKREMNLSSRLPQFKLFMDPASTPIAASSCSSGGQLEPVEVGSKTNDTYTSHRGPMYAPRNLLSDYVSNQRKGFQKTLQPDMKSGAQIVLPSFEKLTLPKRATEKSYLSDSMSSGAQTYHKPIPQTRRSTPSHLALKQAPASPVAPLQRFIFQQPKNQANGIVTFFESHSHFFFKIESSDHLEKRLQSYYGSLPPTEMPLRWKKTAFAACVNNYWHRAEVLSIMGTEAKVLLVDDGRSDVVDLKNLRLLEKEDAVVPVNTVCCALRGVIGEGIGKIKQMEDIVGKQVEARFVSKISNQKYSTILIKGKGVIVNFLMGSPGIDTLLRKVSKIENLEMTVGENHKVKKVGPVLKNRMQRVQLKESEVYLRDIETQLRQEIDQINGSYAPSCGDYVVVFENPYFRRGCITRIAENCVEAYYIDFGVTKDVTKAYMQLLPEHFLVPPAMAVTCINGDWGKMTSWPKDDEFFDVTVSAYEKNVPVLTKIRRKVAEILTKSCSNINRWTEPELQLSTKSVDSVSTISVSPSVPQLPQTATVTCVHSTSMYSVQLNSKKAMLDDLAAEIKKQKLRPVVAPLKAGQVCLVSSDGQWMRAEVLSDGQALFFDYGHRAPLNGNGMHLEKRLADIAPAAVICRAPSHLEKLVEGDLVLVQLSSVEGNRIIALSSEENSSACKDSSDSPSEARRHALVVNYCPPWTVWLVQELDVLNEISSRIGNQLEPALKRTDNFKMGELYACKTADGWFRGRLDKLKPPSAFLIDYGRQENDILQLVPLNGVEKIVPPLATPLQIFEGELQSSRVEAKLSGLLKHNTKVEVLVDPTGNLCVLWVDGQNILEAAGYLIRVVVSHREENGLIWLTRRSKADRITEKLQSVAPGLESLTQADVGCLCLARLSDNKWYRAKLRGHTRLFYTVHLVDYGEPEEAVELKKWWGKEETEARPYKSFKVPAHLNTPFLVLKRDWSEGKRGAVFTLEMMCVN